MILLSLPELGEATKRNSSKCFQILRQEVLGKCPALLAAA